MLKTQDDTLAGLFPASDVSPTRLAHAVVERITQAILDGRLQPGDALPAEARIAASCGVSKPVAREALRELAAMGVVHVQQGKATRVRPLDAEPLGRFFRFAVRGSKEGLVDAIEMRRTIEPPMARLAAQRATPADVEALRGVLARMDASLGDIPAWIEADLDFHDLVAAATHNRLMRFQVRGMRPVNEEIMEQFNARKPRGPAEWRATYERHARVVAAIEERDPELAFAAMSRHFEAADEAVRDLFPQAGRNPEPEAANKKRTGGQDD